MLILLQAADSIGQVEAVAVMVEEAGGVDKIEQLQQHENEDVYNAAYNVIDKYFAGDVSHFTCIPLTLICCISLCPYSGSNSNSKIFY